MADAPSPVRLSQGQRGWHESQARSPDPPGGLGGWLIVALFGSLPSWLVRAEVVVADVESAVVDGGDEAFHECRQGFAFV